MNILWLVQWYKYSPYQEVHLPRKLRSAADYSGQLPCSSILAVYPYGPQMDPVYPYGPSSKKGKTEWSLVLRLALLSFTYQAWIQSAVRRTYPPIMTVLSKYQFYIFENNERWFNDIQIHAPPACNFQTSDDEDFHQLTGNFIQYSTTNSYIVTIWARRY